MKTNYLKTILSSRLITVVLFFSSFSAAFGQELIRGPIDFFLCDTSIIRVFENDSVIICNRNNNNSTFMNIESGFTNSIALYLDSFYVNDFEVFSKKIFFCGYKVEGGEKKAVCGRFGISEFTNFPLEFAIM